MIDILTLVLLMTLSYLAGCITMMVAFVFGNLSRAREEREKPN